jgi:predicted MPP superfamily phosphohydrolase
MRLILIGLFLFSSLQAQEHNLDPFQIMPYINFADNNRFHLNLQSNTDDRLFVKIESEVLNSFFPTNKEHEEVVQSLEFQKIDMGTLECDHQISYSIQNVQNQVLATNKITGFPCSNKKPLYFGFMSDTQIKSGRGKKRAIKISETISELKKEFPTSIIINSGDVVQFGGKPDEWKNYFSLAHNYLQDSFLFAAVGNHDYAEAAAYDKAPAPFLNFLRNESAPDLGYAELDLKRVSILMLNSNFDQMSEAKFNEQWDWLEKKLIINQKLNKPVLVSMHHAPYSSSADYIRPIAKKLRKKLVPMLEKYSCVKMMLAGHLHMYERSQKDRVVYLNSGPSGGIVNYITYLNPYRVFIKPFSTTFSIFKMTEKVLEVTTYSGQKEIIDQFKIDL